MTSEGAGVRHFLHRWAWRFASRRIVCVIARKGADVYMLAPDQMEVVWLEGRRFDRGR